MLRDLSGPSHQGRSNHPGLESSLEPVYAASPQPDVTRVAFRKAALHQQELPSYTGSSAYL